MTDPYPPQPHWPAQPQPPGPAQYADPFGVAPQAPKPKRTGLKILLVLLGVLLLACAGGAGALKVAIGDEYPATVSNPDNIGGLTRLDNPELQRAADDVLSAMRTDIDLTSSMAGVYAEDGDQEHMVLLAAGTAFVFNPGTQLDQAFRDLSSEEGFTDIQDVPAGDLGGAVKCGTVAKSDVALTFCAWADHGSVGIGGFFNRSVAESADRFLKIRGEILHRG